MIVASFLAKDLHLEWQHGAGHFVQWLRRRRPRLEPDGWQRTPTGYPMPLVDHAEERREALRRYDAIRG